MSVKNFDFKWLWIAIGLIICLLELNACRDHEVRELILLHTNDSHGSILSVDDCGGMAERATFIREVRKASPHVLLVDAGDINTGQAVSNMFDGRPDILAYNDMGYDAVTAGNHEFDKPLEVLFRQMQWAAFPFITSNIQYQGKCLAKEYLIKEINGIKVGLFGLTTKNTKNVSVHAKEIDFLDEVKTARRMVDSLKQHKADVIIGLVHLGFSETTPDFITSYKLAEQVEGIDILVDGHSHSYLEWPEQVNNSWIVTANQSGRFVGMGKLKVQDGKLVDLDWIPVKIKGFSQDTVLIRELQPFIQAAKEDLETVVGEAAAVFPLFKRGENIARYEETALGDLVTDALKWKAEGLHFKVDFALTNSGGIREGLPKGLLTKGDILAVLPFSNELEVIALKGSAVRRLFDFVATVVPGNGAFAQVSAEVKVVYNRDTRQVESLMVGGKPVVDEQVYYMATCDYVADGKDGYEAGLNEILSREKTSLLIPDVLMDYIRVKKLISPQTDGRIQVLLAKPENNE